MFCGHVNACTHFRQRAMPAPMQYLNIRKRQIKDSLYGHMIHSDS
ncbi:hypothetical protein EMIT043CA1_20324 [Pseudomonas brassicacearum]